MKVKKRQKKRRGYTVNKHISCVDLGPGECEGFLRMRKSHKRVGGHKWSKLYFVLKEYVLYYYKTKEVCFRMCYLLTISVIAHNNCVLIKPMDH